MDLIAKVMQWALQKEEEIAKECHLSTKDIESQIAKIKEKRDELEQKCKYEFSKIDELLEKLNKIREYSKQCEVKEG